MINLFPKTLTSSIFLFVTITNSNLSYATSYLKQLEEIEKGSKSVDTLEAEFIKYNVYLELYSQAQTELKAGNSAKAIQLLARAREINPWHDGIKETYLLAVQQFIQATLILENESSCEQIISRVDFLMQFAPDSLKDFETILEKCKYKAPPEKKKEPKILDIRLPFSAKPVEQEVFKNFESQLQYITSMNSYLPLRDVLIKGLKFISQLQFVPQEAFPDPFTKKNDTEIKLHVPLTFRFEGSYQDSDLFTEYEHLLEYKYNKHFSDRYYLETGTSKSLPKILYNRKFTVTKRIKEEIGFLWPIPPLWIIEIELHYLNGKIDKHYSFVHFCDYWGLYDLISITGDPLIYSKEAVFAPFHTSEGWDILSQIKSSKPPEMFSAIQETSGCSITNNLSPLLQLCGKSREISFPIKITKQYSENEKWDYRSYLLTFSLNQHDATQLKSIAVRIDVDRMLEFYNTIICHKDSSLCINNGGSVNLNSGININDMYINKNKHGNFVTNAHPGSDDLGVVDVLKIVGVSGLVILGIFLIMI